MVLVRALPHNHLRTTTHSTTFLVQSLRILLSKLGDFPLANLFIVDLLNVSYIIINMRHTIIICSMRNDSLGLIFNF